MKKETIDIYIGQKLFEARHAAGFNKTDFAQKIGINRQQLLKYEQGTNKISIGIATLLKAAEVLSLDLDYFFKDIKPVEWDKKTIEDQKAGLNVSNNFMKIKDKPCRKAISALLSALARIASSENTASGRISIIP